MYYFMLFAATILFSFQFLFNQRFEEECGSSLSSAMLFSLYSSIIGAVLLFMVNGGRIEFSLFSFVMAVLYAIVGILYTIMGVKAFSEINLSMYSVFAMLGGMVLPSIYGIVFLEEQLSVLKTICFLCMIAAVLLEIDFSQKTGRKIYYLSVFILNGLVGVVSVIHQGSSNFAVDSSSFLMISRFISAFISLISLAACEMLKNSKNIFKRTTKKSLFYSSGYAILCTIGNLFVLIALKHLPASVQYPIITGGVMIVSLIISIIRAEDVKPKDIAATVIAFISTVLIAV